MKKTPSKATGSGRTISDYFSPKSSIVKDHCQGSAPLPAVQETPIMKPSQPSNQLSNPLPKVVLPLKSPEKDHMDKLPLPPLSAHVLGSNPPGGIPVHMGNLNALNSKPQPASMPSMSSKVISRHPIGFYHLLPIPRIDPLLQSKDSTPSSGREYRSTGREEVNRDHKGHVSLEHRRIPTTEGIRPGRSLSLKRHRHPDSEDRHNGEDRAKRPRPQDLSPGPERSPSSGHHGGCRIAPLYVRKNIISQHNSPSLRISEHSSLKKPEGGNEREMEERRRMTITAPSFPLSTTKPMRQLFIDLPRMSSRENGGHLESGNPQRSLSRGEGRAESRGVESRGELTGHTGIPKPASHQSSNPQCPNEPERKRTLGISASTRQNDLDKLFTPDPVVSVSSYIPQPRPAQSSTEGGGRTTSVHKASLSSTAASVRTTVEGSSSKIIWNLKTTCSSEGLDSKIFSSPYVRLEPSDWVKLEKGSFIKTSSSLLSLGKSSSYKTEDATRHGSLSQVKSNTFETETTAASKDTRTPSPHLSLPSPLDLGGEGVGVGGRGELGDVDDDPLDAELGLGLSCVLGLDLSQSSSSSEEEQLLSLQEILDRSAKRPDTPDKSAFSEPAKPVLSRCHAQPPVASQTKPINYKNTLEQMLMEKKSYQRSKELEMKLLMTSKEDLLRLVEEEENEKNIEESISHEQKEFLQRYSVVSNAIPDQHPGEVVFSLADFGRLFNQHTLQLRHLKVTPQETAQKTLLWSSPDQFSFHVSARLIQAAYCSSPCPPQVSHWLFQMMSVHTERDVSYQILQALRDIALSAAKQIVLDKSHRYDMWVPSIGDVTLVLMNMGVPFVTLFPLERLQPNFTEGDLLLHNENSSSRKKELIFPEHNFQYVVKYLSDCSALCPWAYSDSDLLLLLTVVSRVALDTQLTPPVQDLRLLQHNLVNNMKDWNHMLPKICFALMDMTDDHHNLRWLIQLLPDNTRGKQLRRHLSMSIISKLLINRCTYKPSNTEFQLSDLRRYLPRMRPSLLLRGLQSSRSHREQEEDGEDSASLDQQAYYLCYSLLALANEASNFEFFPPNQKNQLLLLCAELEKYIKCDIRESEKCLYRSKVKDFVARIYTKWQVLLQRSRPLQGKLYDYWQPLPEDTMNSSHEQPECSGRATDGEGEEEDEVVRKVQYEVKPEVEIQNEQGMVEKKSTIEEEVHGEEEEKEDEMIEKEEEVMEEEEERMELTLEESEEESGKEKM